MAVTEEDQDRLDTSIGGEISREIQFREDGVDVILDRFPREEHPLGYGVVARTGSDLAENLALAWRQATENVTA